MNESSKRKLWITIALLIIFVLSFHLRWQYVEKTRIIKPIRADAYYYVTIARNLANHGLFTSADPPLRSTPEARPPGYCFFLAGIFMITTSFQSFYITTLMVQAVLGSLTVILTFYLARFLLPPFWSLIPAILVMISPHLIAINAYFLTESLFTFLLVSSLVLLCYAFHLERKLLFALAGFTIGAAILVRPVLGVFPIICFFLIYMIRERQNRKSVILPLIFFIFFSYASQGLWGVWKNTTFGKDTVMASQLKSSILQGTYPKLTHNKIPGMPYREDPNYEVLLDKGYPAIASHILKRFTDNPFSYSSWWFLGKPSLFWSWNIFFSDGINIYPVKYSWFDTNRFMGFLRQLMVKTHTIFVVLGLASILIFFSKSNKRASSTERFAYLLIILLLAHFTLMFTILAPFPRYAVPLGPELYIVATFVIWSSAKNIKMKRKSIRENNE